MTATIGKLDTIRAANLTIDDADVEAFERDGYLIVRGMFGADDIEAITSAIDAMHARGKIEGCFDATVTNHEDRLDGGKPAPDVLHEDPLLRYPRMMHPHKVDATALRYMLDARIEKVLSRLFDNAPLAAQSMVYWKPAGSRGQALHQDNFYLQVRPGNCIAAWIALDPADRENGGMVVVPGSHRADVLCPEEADLSVSFTNHFVRPPEGLSEVPVDLASGDCLFFGGNLIHGSHPNTSKDRMRRAFIGHYVSYDTEAMSPWYQPLLAMDGSEVKRDVETGGGPCGTVVNAPH